MSVPSGRQVLLRHGPWAATVVEVGGGLRILSRAGVALLDGYAAEEMASGGRGQPLIPWPNRMAGGAYEFGGRRIQAPVSEPSTGGAIHGLVRWSNWRVAASEPASCAMALRLHPQPAYPFTLDLRIDYALGDDGLTVTLTAENAGAEPLPFGAGFHPYLTAGTAVVDDAVLSVPAATWLPTDGRAIPTGERRAVEGRLDFRVARPVGDTVLDHCFTDLARDSDGLARVTLEGPGSPVILWMDEAFGHLMVFTGDTLPAGHRRRGVAVEPMTCAADAFNSGDGLRVIAPRQQFVGRWGVGAG
ncbi:MAG: aldose 1-epimerase family protein [Thermoleophilia bacterium]|nr:aldose 1-epimerase family protein [Thermoleophilia bacterium]